MFVPMDHDGTGFHAPSVGAGAWEECSVALRSSPGVELTMLGMTLMG